MPHFGKNKDEVVLELYGEGDGVGVSWSHVTGEPTGIPHSEIVHHVFGSGRTSHRLSQG